MSTDDNQTPVQQATDVVVPTPAQPLPTKGMRTGTKVALGCITLMVVPPVLVLALMFWSFRRPDDETNYLAEIALHAPSAYSAARLREEIRYQPAELSYYRQFSYFVELRDAAGHWSTVRGDDVEAFSQADFEDPLRERQPPSVAQEGAWLAVQVAQRPQVRVDIASDGQARHCETGFTFEPSIEGCSLTCGEHQHQTRTDVASCECDQGFSAGPHQRGRAYAPIVCTVDVGPRDQFVAAAPANDRLVTCGPWGLRLYAIPQSGDPLSEPVAAVDYDCPGGRTFLSASGDRVVVGTRELQDSVHPMPLQLRLFRLVVAVEGQYALQDQGPLEIQHTDHFSLHDGLLAVLLLAERDNSAAPRTLKVFQLDDLASPSLVELASLLLPNVDTLVLGANHLCTTTAYTYDEPHAIVCTPWSLEAGHFTLQDESLRLATSSPGSAFAIRENLLAVQRDGRLQYFDLSRADPSAAVAQQEMRSYSARPMAIARDRIVVGQDTLLLPTEVATMVAPAEPQAGAGLSTETRRR